MRERLRFVNTLRGQHPSPRLQLRRRVEGAEGTSLVGFVEQRDVGEVNGSWDRAHEVRCGSNRVFRRTIRALSYCAKAPKMSTLSLTISRDTYDAADAITRVHWPVHNRQQGIKWEMATVGLIARDKDDEEVGAATIKLVGGTAYLEQLVVAPEKIRRGTGTALLREFERLAVEADCHVMELETAETQARPFYEKHGFVVVAEKPNSKFGLTWFFMQKRIA